jgi:hypothetical protein
MHAELSTVICSGAMRGKEHTYASFDERVPSIPGPAGEDALGELAWRYFSTRGPATLKDFVWWSGLKAADARTGLELIREKLDSRVVDDRVYWYVEKRPQSRGARIDLVQCYDEVIISYAESRDILQTGTSSFPLPRHIDGFTHVVLLGGRLLGHWRAASGRAGLTVETRLAERLGDAECDAMRSAIDRFLSFRRVGPVEWETR